MKVCDKATNTLPDVQQVFHHQETDDIPLEDSTPKETLESLEEDTSSVPEYDNTQQDDGLSTISEEVLEEEEDPADEDTLLFDEEIDQSDNEHFDTAVDMASDDS